MVVKAAPEAKRSKVIFYQQLAMNLGVNVASLMRLPLKSYIRLETP